jgi:hypothetical protein
MLATSIGCGVWLLPSDCVHQTCVRLSVGRVVDPAVPAQRLDHRLPGARDEPVEDSEQEHVACGAYHGSVERRIQIDEFLMGAMPGASLGQGATDPSEFSRRMTLGDESGGFGFNCYARLEYGDDVSTNDNHVPALDDVDGNDDHAGALSRREHTTAAKLPDGFAQGGAADTQLGRECRPAGKFGAQRPFAAPDALQQQFRAD